MLIGLRGSLAAVVFGRGLGSGRLDCLMVVSGTYRIGGVLQLSAVEAMRTRVGTGVNNARLVHTELDHVPRSWNVPAELFQFSLQAS